MLCHYPNRRFRRQAGKRQIFIDDSAPTHAGYVDGSTIVEQLKGTHNIVCAHVSRGSDYTGPI